MRHGRTRPLWAGARVLAKLGIRGKLNLLLVPPLAAVLLVSVPFVLKQAESASGAGDTAQAARNTQAVGGLISQVQREGLLAAAFVAAPASSDADLIRQQHAVDATADQVRAQLGPAAPDELTTVLARVASLRDERQNTLHRSISAERVARTYDTVVSSVIDALRLVPRSTDDAEGVRQLTALEALLRADEEESLRVTALVVAAQSQPAGQSLLDETTQRAQVHTDRFTRLAEDDQAALVVNVDSGAAAHRVDQLATQLPGPDQADAYVWDVLAAGQQQADERRAVQDRVTGEITDAAGARAAAGARLAWLVGAGAAVLFGLVAFLAIAVSRSIADPLRRLTSAATSVADLADAELVRVGDTEAVDDHTPRLATIDVASDDELGALATAFNRVQTTAAALVERQTLTRRNTSLMFANVAKRTQNLVGRQLALVDELERHERDERALAGLFRLDHLSARLRRTADNLLVVSGIRDDNPIGGPIHLTTAVRAALAEIEDFPRVQLGEIPDVQLASSLGADLVRLFAELLENATSFSPPTTTVEVETSFLDDGDLVVSIVDHGIGMAAETLEHENRRLVERERLELAPTSVLGLFVAGRLARRHSLSVELITTEDTGGVTARVTVPREFFSRTAAPAAPAPVETAPAAEAAGLFDAAPQPEPLPAPAIAALAVPAAGEFTWFRDPKPEPEWPAAEPAEQAEPAERTKPAKPGESFSGSLDGDDLATELFADPPQAVPEQQTVESVVARAKALAERLVRDNPGTATQQFAPVRRVPGAQLAPGLRAQQTIRMPVRALTRRGLRDPAAERAVFDSYSDGVAKADAIAGAGVACVDQGGENSA
ncbi:nitrate- and nitrite sensing domain-containing protein [Amycolatopsis sp. FDAARGOS 1241]|uniref:sensor histidine kinase n=1 Tax=Amycolatopsis sp. FDAARGOS 1241 TaxID=2778070 RepID=UPI0019517EBC|nr:nitrate- and nitrite sensing domain-containing protein [Amycolatopsis sp. FDAARGOS 1241]QRP46471.1 sensor histidine kinase [Amycolatopsis sp. FDAARGOS 1241]